MKIEVLQEQLLRGLAIVGRAVASRAQLPVLSHILVEAKMDGLTLSATDLEIGIRVKVAAKVMDEGRVAVPAKMFEEFLSSLNPGKVELRLEKDSLIFSTALYSGKFQTINAEEFPAIAETTKEAEICILEGATLSLAVTRVVFASARDSLRPALTGVLVEFGEKKMRLVATDGFRLATEEIAVEVKAGQGVLLVPSRAWGEVVRLAGEGRVSIGHLVETNQIYFKMGEIQVVSQLLSGNFPDYQKILPKEFTSEISINKDELLQAVKATHIFARDNSNMVKWQIGGGKLVLTSSSPERGECRVEVAVALTGEELEIIFNAKYVLDYLSIVEGSTLWIGMGNKLSPGMIKDPDRPSGQYIVMPINA
ncbi:MAG: DNA polymerase III subunit beta [Patescibacteria group bacterium]|nr:DNA polymerase III subunit beta [Patescibacteria group bacterium]